MADYIPDPDYEGFDGVYLDPKMSNVPPCRFDLSAIAEYMKKNSKSYDQLSEKEKSLFSIQ